MIADIGESIADSENLMTLCFSLDEGEQIDIAMRCECAPRPGSDQEDADQVASSAALHMPDGHFNAVFKSWRRRTLRLFRRLRHVEQLGVQFFTSRSGGRCVGFHRHQ